jgi:hypothetical protein
MSAKRVYAKPILVKGPALADVTSQGLPVSRAVNG